MRFRICALCSIVAALLASPAWTGEPKPGAFDRGDNALWMRRHWLHEGPSNEEIAALVESLRERGIRRIYPFLGPMDAEGWPGWRSKAGHVRYVPERAAAFIAEIHRIAPEIRVIPGPGEISTATCILTIRRSARRLLSTRGGWWHSARMACSSMWSRFPAELPIISRCFAKSKPPSATARCR